MKRATLTRCNKSGQYLVRIYEFVRGGGIKCIEAIYFETLESAKSYQRRVK